MSQTKQQLISQESGSGGEDDSSLEIFQRICAAFVMEQRAEMRDRLNRLIAACTQYRRTGDTTALDAVLSEWPAGMERLTR